MSTTDPPSGAAAAPRETLAGALGDRSLWLLFALGVATGAPASWGWYQLVVWPGYSHFEWWLWLPLTHFGVVSIASLILAPFFDRAPAPFFRSLGHRRSWVAVWLIGALAIILLLAAAGALLPHRLAVGSAAAVLGIAAMPIAAALWLSIDALRIETRPGRGQAYAVAAQYVGALLALGIVARLGDDGTAMAKVAALGGLLALGVAAIFLLRGDRNALHADALAGSRRLGLRHIGRLLARPWTSFFARHGRASGLLLLAALALYALGGSVAEHLGKNGHLYDILDPARPDAEGDRHAQAGRLVTPFELLLSLLGGVMGMVAARSLAPARAFVLLQCAVMALIAFFLVCKLALGFTVITVGLLYAARALLVALAIVVYAVVAARLTVRPHFAGQYAMLGAFVSLFWLSEVGLNWIGPSLGGYATAGAGIAASFAAILCMRIATRVARRAGN